MTRRRWIADEVRGTRAALIGAHAEHLSRVLRARVGQEFDITVGDEVRRGRITAIAEDRVEFELGDLVPVSAAPHITLALSIFKFDRMEWAIEKCTELGASRIVPVVSRRTEPHLAAAAAKRVERWRRIAVQAAEQSRRIGPPEISQVTKLKDVLTLPESMRIVLSETEKEAMLRQVLQSHFPEGTVVLALGPEGGWAEEETSAFRQAGWLSASLGGTILRTETAAIAAMAVTLAELHP